MKTFTFIQIHAAQMYSSD